VGAGYGINVVRHQEGCFSARETITIHKEEKMNAEETKYQRARKRVEAIKGFYIHLGVYLVVNLFLFLLNIITSPDQLWFYWVLLGWGIGIVAHAFFVFGFGRLFGADWEEKKIREIMEESNQD
jgi:Na+/melibiose symporter-like transporter